MLHDDLNICSTTSTIVYFAVENVKQVKKSSVASIVTDLTLLS